MILVQQFLKKCLFGQHPPRTRIDDVVGFVRKVTSTRFGAFLSTGNDVRQAPLTDEEPAIVFSIRRPHSMVFDCELILERNFMIFPTFDKLSSKASLAYTGADHDCKGLIN